MVEFSLEDYGTMNNIVDGMPMFKPFGATFQRHCIGGLRRWGWDRRSMSFIATIHVALHVWIVEWIAGESIALKAIFEA